MTLAEQLVLDHSWPLCDRDAHFELGYVLNCAVTDIITPSAVGDLNLQHSGCWECDLSDNSLTWSGGVYDIFGLPRGARISRDECAALYCEESRTKMERLRAHSIKHRRGFTLDAEVWTAIGEKRWMRLIAAPVCVGERVSRLHGLKLII